VDLKEVLDRLSKIEQENNTLKKQLSALESRTGTLEKSASSSTVGSKSVPAPTATPVPEPVAAADDDDIDLFGDEEETEDEKRIKAERLAAYDAKKSKKPTLIAKSNIILDVKPWDDETDLKLLEDSVRSISMDGLLWGTSKLVPVAFGIKKLQITCVVEDDKVSTEDLEERLLAFEDFIQSVDIVAFNKI